MGMLAEHADHVIGVDTHRDAHSAAVVATGTGTVAAQTTVAADAEVVPWLVELEGGGPPASSGRVGTVASANRKSEDRRTNRHEDRIG